MITVVAALLHKDNKVLIAKRKSNSNFGKWEFPGGKVELDETEKQAIEREILEEFELFIKANKFIVNNIHEYPEKVIDLRLYECEYLKGDFKLHDHSEYKWVNIKDLLEYDLAEADIPLVLYLQKNNIY